MIANWKYFFFPVQKWFTSVKQLRKALFKILFIEIEWARLKSELSSTEQRVGRLLSIEVRWRLQDMCID